MQRGNVGGAKGSAAASHKLGFQFDVLVQWQLESHLHTVVQVQEKTTEWQIELWMAFIDFQKAFDTVEFDKGSIQSLILPNVSWRFIHSGHRVRN